MQNRNFVNNYLYFRSGLIIIIFLFTDQDLLKKWAKALTFVTHKYKKESENIMYEKINCVEEFDKYEE